MSPTANEGKGETGDFRGLSNEPAKVGYHRAKCLDNDE